MLSLQVSCLAAAGAAEIGERPQQSRAFGAPCITCNVQDFLRSFWADKEEKPAVEKDEVIQIVIQEQPQPSRRRPKRPERRSKRPERPECEVRKRRGNDNVATLTIH